VRESVSHCVRRAGLVLDGEIEAQQFANPVVLGNRGEALVKEVLEAVVVRLDGESVPPQVRPPMPNSEDEADELAFICRQGAMARRDRSTEERDQVRVLDEHGPEAIRGHIAFHDEGLGEVGKSQYGGRRHRVFEGSESRLGVGGPEEPVLL
jgi:hypothetical protein